MKIISLAYSILLALALTGCNSSKTSLSYFEDLKNVQTGTFGTNDFNVKIAPDDELTINVTSINPLATAEYNLPLNTSATKYEATSNMVTLRTQTYLVDAAGDIKFPRLGTLHVAGMTTEQLEAMLTKRISAEVADPIVKVGIMNFRVNVLGEVNRPGAQGVYSNRYSLLDALASAGDLSPHGERSNVMLIREENGKKVIYRFDLNDSKTLESPYFYLQPNDVIYVEPNNVKKSNAKYDTNNSYKLSLASAIISGASVIASLVIALALR